MSWDCQTGRILSFSPTKGSATSSIRFLHAGVLFPNWRHCDYALLSIKVNDLRAFHLPCYSLWRRPDDLIRPAGVGYRAMLKAKPGFCSFLTWYDDRTVRNRSEFFKKLHARKPVDSAGRALNNTGGRVPMGREPKLEFLRRYKFNICFENRDLPGWTTEKFTDALASGTVPIFWGTAP